MRSAVSNFPSADVSTATTNMSTKVFTATSTEMFTATAMTAAAMAAPTALGHRRLSTQIYQGAERNGHCKYFDKAGCHRRTPLRKGNLRQSIEFHKQTFRIALAMSALGQKQTCAMHQPMSALPPIATAKADFRTRSCPLYPQKRKAMSALGQKRTSTGIMASGSRSNAWCRFQ
jgi:hypothetical protein